MEEKAVYAVLDRAGVTRPPSAESIRKPRPQDGLLTRIAARAGHPPEPDVLQPPVEENAIDAWLASPEAFFQWLGISLFPYQQEALALIRTNDRIVVVWPRSHGKDTLT